MPPAVQDNPPQHRFEATIDGHLAQVSYRVHGNVMTLVRTDVPEALKGQGVAGALVQAALDHARAHAMKVDPVCTYAKAYMERHPESMALHV